MPKTEGTAGILNIEPAFAEASAGKQGILNDEVNKELRMALRNTLSIANALSLNETNSLLLEEKG